MLQKKRKKEADNATQASVKREMAKPRMARSARMAEFNLDTAIPDQPGATIGAVDKIIPFPRPSPPERAQIAGSLIGRPVRFRADFYTTRIMPSKGWTGTIEEERRSSSGQGVTSYIVLLDEPFRSQEQNPRVDTTEDEMEPF